MSSRIILLWALLAVACPAITKMAFTVSMPQPSNHTYHVTFRCDGMKGELHDFKMPRWSPGYYGIRDYAGSVSNFRAEDASGHALAWEKVARNREDDPPHNVVGTMSMAHTVVLGRDLNAAPLRHELRWAFNGLEPSPQPRHSKRHFS